MLVRFRFFVVILLLPFSTAAAIDETTSVEKKMAGDLKIYSEENPPFNYTKNGRASGLYVDLILEIFEKMGISKTRNDIIIGPWARAYNQTLLRKNSLLFAVVRSPSRESSFKWVGPIGEYRAVILVRKDKDLDPSAAKLKGYTFGATKKSLEVQFLHEYGIDPDHIIFINSPRSAAHMLERGRIDAWVRDHAVARWTLQNLGYSNADFVVKHAFEPQPRYIAVNKDTSDAFIQEMQAALDSLRRSGRLAKITRFDLPNQSMPSNLPSKE